MEQRPSWVYSQEISRRLWNPQGWIPRSQEPAKSPYRKPDDSN